MVLTKLTKRVPIFIAGTARPVPEADIKDDQAGSTLPVPVPVQIAVRRCGLNVRSSLEECILRAINTLSNDVYFGILFNSVF